MLSVNGFRAALRYLTMFKEGMICTVSLSFLTVVFGFLLALVLALMRMSRVKPLSIFASIYVEVFRATPMLVQLFIIYYIVFGGVRCRRSSCSASFALSAFCQASFRWR